LTKPGSAPARPTTVPPADLDDLIAFLRHQRSFDASGRRSMLQDCAEQRQGVLGLTTIDQYIDHLSLHPAEIDVVLDTLLEDARGFFLDDALWSCFGERCLARLLAEREPPAPVRFWVPGCATGEDVYTLTMIVAERIGRDSAVRRLKVYGTDIDDAALAHARRGWYSNEALKNMSADLRDRYFTPSDGGHVFDAGLRQRVVFGRHDVLEDAPISRVDGLFCRNLLIYFPAEAQARMIERLRFALAPHGCLVLGRSDVLIGDPTAFRPVDHQAPIFWKRTERSRRERALAMYVDPQAGHGTHVDLGALGDLGAATDLGGLGDLASAAFDSAVRPQLAVDGNGRLALVNRAARRTFGLTLDDIGRPFAEVEVSHRPVELGAALAEVSARGAPVLRHDVEMPSENLVFDVEITPLTALGGPPGHLVAFVDTTEAHRLRSALEHAAGELNDAHEQLQASNEELETASEVLHSTIEQFEITNEELASLKGALETMNAELDTTNQELSAINAELRDRTAEIDRANAFFGSILDGLDLSVVVVDGDLTVRAWNGRSAELWGVPTDDAMGRPLLSLDIGLPVGAATSNPSIWRRSTSDPARWRAEPAAPRCEPPAASQTARSCWSSRKVTTTSSQAGPTART